MPYIKYSSFVDHPSTMDKFASFYGAALYTDQRIRPWKDRVLYGIIPTLLILNMYAVGWEMLRLIMVGLKAQTAFMFIIRFYVIARLVLDWVISPSIMPVVQDMYRIRNGPDSVISSMLPSIIRTGMDNVHFQLRMIKYRFFPHYFPNSCRETCLNFVGVFLNWISLGGLITLVVNMFYPIGPIYLVHTSVFSFMVMFYTLRLYVYANYQRALFDRANEYRNNSEVSNMDHFVLTKRIFSTFHQITQMADNVRRGRDVMTYDPEGRTFIASRMDTAWNLEMLPIEQTYRNAARPLLKLMVHMFPEFANLSNVDVTIEMMDMFNRLQTPSDATHFPIPTIRHMLLCDMRRLAADNTYMTGNIRVSFRGPGNQFAPALDNIAALVRSVLADAQSYGVQIENGPTTNANAIASALSAVSAVAAGAADAIAATATNAVTEVATNAVDALTNAATTTVAASTRVVDASARVLTRAVVDHVTQAATTVGQVAEEVAEAVEEVAADVSDATDTTDEKHDSKKND
jgi:hypothetical protein